MRLEKPSIIGFVICIAIIIPFLMTSNVSAEEVEIPAGTPVALRFTQTISSEEAALGQSVSLSAARDIIVKGKVVIKAGAPAQASIVTVKKKGAIGEAGELIVSARSVTAVDGTEVPLRDTMSITGKEKVGGTVALSAIICPLFLLRKGEEARITSGSELRAYVDYPVKIKIEK